MKKQGLIWEIMRYFNVTMQQAARALFTSYPHGESLSSPRRPVSNVAQDSFDRQTICKLLPALHACVMAAHRRIYSAAGKYGEDMDLCKDNDKCMDFIIM